ncbi:hypothetical protein SAMN06298216_2816 [Spirosomataceae bacterium TFI 002]|nr:hypothetical protein SAMN06298216_2816 [Spirosomataceae bacterium TFI 002]
MQKLIYLLCILPGVLIGQSTFYKDSSYVLSTLPTDSVYRSGPVAISHAFPSPYQNRLMVTGIYDSTDSRAGYFSLNQPYLYNPMDSSSVGLATRPTESHNVLVANNYANFKTGVTFTDVHNSTTEFNYFRGIKDYWGFRDGGDIAKAAVLKLAGNFSNNNRAYKTTDFDILNMRFFTDTVVGNMAKITNFYALRFEDFRGVNTDMITNGWGVYIKPTILKNFFGGMVGVGTDNVTNQLTVSAVSDPVKFVGLSTSSDKDFVTIDNNGVLHRKNAQNFSSSFVSTMTDTNLSSDYYLYIHEGPAATYTLPAANTRTGMTWRIVNIGSGQITLSESFYEGDQLRNTILNKAGLYSFDLFSDGTKYIAIK